MNKDLQIFSDDGSSRMTGKVLTGAALLSQRMLVILLTRVTEALREGEGTMLTDLFYNGAAGYEQSALEGVITIAASDAVKDYYRNMDEVTPDDQRVSSYVLESVSRNLDTIVITMRLTTASGESYVSEGVIA